MLDDVGFGRASTFGGEIETPTFTRLANEGISYNAFQTTAMCSPTCTALMPGRNHNRGGFGQIAELANDGMATPGSSRNRRRPSQRPLATAATRRRRSARTITRRWMPWATVPTTAFPPAAASTTLSSHHSGAVARSYGRRRVPLFPRRGDCHLDNRRGDRDINVVCRGAH